ncbi:MAG TPA: hypothetical protein CFH84_11935 [Sulfurimonas sp. UBA12504]|nr:MAG: hypothetical protein A2019_09190 [Sulfurimonas sp. GWF2_37_8]DAB29001.1 MAG TPA: hypothetical protein CFH84_11935 [Sulfurimonas sp. UBA12504]
MAKIKLGTTLSGALWLQNITKSFSIDSRFARGKTYFNKGYVKKFSLVDNFVEASVKGSYGNYSTNFDFDLDEMMREKIIAYFHSNPMAQSSLLNGLLEQSFFDWCENEQIMLFPSNEKKIIGIRYRSILNYEALCTCYDFSEPSYPCKHIYALLFALCAEIDNNPLVLLKLHGVEVEEIVASLEIEHELEYPVAINFSEDFAPRDDAKTPLQILHQEDATHFIMSLLPSNPPFAPVDYKVALAEFYKASKVALPQILTPIHNENMDKIERLFKESKIEIIADKSMRTNKAILKHKVFRQEDTIIELLEPYIINSNKLGCTLHLIDFMRLFLSFKSEEGSAYYRYFYQLCRVGYLLLHANAFIPAVINEDAKKRLFIAWTPLGTQSFHEQLEVTLPHALSCVRHTQRGDFFDALSGTKMFLSALMRDYVTKMNFMHKKSIKNPPDISKAFFCGEAFSQKAAGRQNIDRAIANTFAIFMLAKNRYTLIASLDLQEQDQQYRFSLYVTQEGEETKLFLKDALTNDSSKELLKLMAPIRTILPEVEDLFVAQSIQLERNSFENFILERASLLSALGVKIELPKELHNLIKPRLAILAKSKKSPNSFLDLQKILEYDWVVAIGEHKLSMEEFMELVKEQGQIISYKESFITLSAEELKNLLASAKKKTKLTSYDILREKFSGNLFLDTTLENFFEKLFRDKNLEISQNLHADLRAYQSRGITWALNNLLNNFGVILADDMGLGKTVQTIGILLYLYEHTYAQKQALVVVPTSLLNNWQNELSKFAPTLDYALYYGQARTMETSKIIITTYDTLKRDTLLKEHPFDVIVIDEAQKIKNPDTQAAIAVKGIHAKYKIALSGTPVENSLSELWSIFDFALHGYLGELSHFINRYAKPIEIEKDTTAAAALKNITAPFMLRRLKTDKSIISDLPDKIVIDEYASLNPKQAALYQSVVDTTMQKLETLPSNERFGLIFKLITELKQICNHPRNFDKQSPLEAELSGKTEMLLEILESIVAKGEKVLIFTQYVEMANILAEIIEKSMLIEPLRLDGSMSKNARQNVVDTFEQSSENPIFILSLKAGGVGLNLTSASNVIHYDLWFNPAVENQATDRAFRIGQSKNVFVYRFITKNSFEEKIDNMIKAKLAIGEMSIAVGEKNISSMSNEEISTLFR